jgi:hypothetical protein
VLGTKTIKCEVVCCGDRDTFLDPKNGGKFVIYGDGVAVLADNYCFCVRKKQ